MKKEKEMKMIYAGMEQSIYPGGCGKHRKLSLPSASLSAKHMDYVDKLANGEGERSYAGVPGLHSVWSSRVPIWSPE